MPAEVICPKCGKPGRPVVRMRGRRRYLYISHGTREHYAHPIDGRNAPPGLLSAAAFDALDELRHRIVNGSPHDPGDMESELVLLNEVISLAEWLKGRMAFEVYHSRVMNRPGSLPPGAPAQGVRPRPDHDAPRGLEPLIGRFLHD
ncbi:MAG: hypothetical protein ACP5LG_06530 [Conexivisphaera sp.]